jgi:hypothetical protein
MSPDASPVLELRANAPERQRRWSVFFRAILVLPHYLVLGIIGNAVAVASMLGWFAALFTGRNPFHRFVVGYLRWHARAYAYAWLLTDCYPPFSFDSDEKYPIDITLESGPLSRLTVIFRLLLIIPAYVVVALLMAGMAIFGFVGWVATLFRATLPTPLHDAFRASLRFLLRTEAYLFLVQHRYPSGLFGDPSPATSSIGANALDTQVAASTLAAPEDEPTPESPIAPASALGDESGANATVVTLGTGAKRVVIGQLVSGVVIAAAYVVLLVVVASALSTGRVWFNNYGGRVSTVQLTVSTTLNDLATTPPHWSAIAADCAQVTNALSAIDTVPQYPVSGPNHDLLAGVAEITVAAHACVANIAPGHLSQYLPQLASTFAKGNAYLNTFVQAVP